MCEKVPLFKKAIQFLNKSGRSRMNTLTPMLLPGPNFKGRAKMLSADSNRRKRVGQLETQILALQAKTILKATASTEQA